MASSIRPPRALVRPWLRLLLIAPLACGCGADDETVSVPSGPEKIGKGPYGEIASTAAEAFPGAPQPPPLSREDVLAGCAAWAVCDDVDPLAGSAFESRLELCIRDMVLPSAERAIPMTVLLAGLDDRAEPFVRCAVDAADCAGVAACLSERASTIYCEEDGCLAFYAYEVTCEGTVATLKTGGAPIVRDCARALAACDPTSHTGCTDRQFSRCDPAIDKSDRCDGDVRLGCDGEDQVSYHDCARLGGTCGPTPEGGQDCLYPSSLATPCTDVSPACEGTTLSACLLGDRVSVEAPEGCAGP